MTNIIILPMLTDLSYREFLQQLGIYYGSRVDRVRHCCYRCGNFGSLSTEE